MTRKSRVKGSGRATPARRSQRSSGITLGAPRNVDPSNQDADLSQNRVLSEILLSEASLDRLKERGILAEQRNLEALAIYGALRLYENSESVDQRKGGKKNREDPRRLGNAAYCLRCFLAALELEGEMSESAAAALDLAFACLLLSSPYSVQQLETINSKRRGEMLREHQRKRAEWFGYFVQVFRAAPQSSARQMALQTIDRMRRAGVPDSELPGESTLRGYIGPMKKSLEDGDHRLAVLTLSLLGEFYRDLLSRP